MPYANERRYQLPIQKDTQAIVDIIPAPGVGKTIAIDFISLNPSGGANTITMTGDIAVVYVLNDNQPLTLENAIQDPEGLLRCAPNTAWKLTLGAATQVEGFVSYRILGS